jgi:NADH/NAD ratio-sensing transcriptional regulator Rex
MALQQVGTLDAQKSRHQPFLYRCINFRAGAAEGYTVTVLRQFVQQTVMQRHGVALATVGVYALNTTDDKLKAMRSAVTQHVMAHDGVLQMHGFYVNEAEHCIVFDVVLDFAVADRDGLYEHIVSDVKELYPDYNVVVTLDRDLSD